MGIVDALRPRSLRALGDSSPHVRRVSGAPILCVAVTTSMSGFAGSPSRSASTASSRARSAGSTGARSYRPRRSSPRWSSRRAPIVTSFFQDHVASLASLFSFGVLLAFTAAQLAVMRLRFSEPERAAARIGSRSNVRVRGVEVPLPALVGAALPSRSGSSRCHAPGRSLRRPRLAARRPRRLRPRSPRPRRRADRARPLGRRAVLARSCEFKQILVPMKLGGSARRWSRPRSSSRRSGRAVSALYVIRVPARPAARLRSRRGGGARRGVARRGDAPRRRARRPVAARSGARPIGQAIVDAATQRAST